MFYTHSKRSISLKVWGSMKKFYCIFLASVTLLVSTAFADSIAIINKAPGPMDFYLTSQTPQSCQSTSLRSERAGDTVYYFYKPPGSGNPGECTYSIKAVTGPHSAKCGTVTMNAERYSKTQTVFTLNTNPYRSVPPVPYSCVLKKNR